MPRSNTPGSRALLVLAATVVLLAVALVITGVISARTATQNAHEGLRARVAERLWAVTSGARAVGGERAQPLIDFLAELDTRDGSVRFMLLDGTVIASTSPDERGTRQQLPDGMPRPAGEVVFGEADGLLTAWASTPMLGGRRPPPPHHRPPPHHGGIDGPFPGLVIAASVPIEDSLIGVTEARTQLALSIAAALLLLIVAGVAIGANRRAARLRDEVERKQRLASLGQLAAILAHEVRTPVAAVRGFAQVLLERLPTDEVRLKDPADRIVRETDRLGRLVDDLLGYARPTAPAFQDAELADLATDSAERMALIAEARDVRLLCDAVPPIPARVDPGRITQVIDNLVLNAIQASPAGETVVIRAEPQRGGALLEVADRGAGVPESERDAIFEPFHTDKAGGTGLGLAVCRRIADEHGAELSIHDNPGGGALFRVQLLG